MPELSPDIPERIWRRAIADVLSQLRLAAGLTQATAAAYAGMSRTHLIALEAGKHTPSIRVMANLTRTYGLYLKDFIELVQTHAIMLENRRKGRKLRG